MNSEKSADWGAKMHENQENEFAQHEVLHVTTSHTMRHEQKRGRPRSPERISSPPCEDILATSRGYPHFPSRAHTFSFCVSARWFPHRVLPSHARTHICINVWVYTTSAAPGPDILGARRGIQSLPPRLTERGGRVKSLLHKHLLAIYDVDALLQGLQFLTVHVVNGSIAC